MRSTEATSGGNTIRRLAVYWLPVAAWMGLIFLLSAQPDLPHPPSAFLDHVVKKGGHMAAFAILAWLWWRALHRERGMPMGVALGLALMFTVLYAVSDEVHQSFVPGRKPRATDVLFDSLGASAMVIIIRLVRGAKAR